MSYIPSLAITKATTQSGSSYTLALGDAQTQIIFTSTTSVVRVSIPPSVFRVPTKIECIFAGSKSLVFDAGAGVTVSLPNNYFYVNSKYTGAVLVQTASNTWVVTGLSGGTVPVSRGYVAGGYGPLASMDVVTFSTGVTVAATTVSAGLVLGTARFGMSPISDTVAYGYFVGGNTGTSGGTAMNTNEFITFSSGVVSNNGNTLSATRAHAYSVSDGTLYGYVAGGRTSSILSSVDRLTFSTGAFAAITNTLTTIRSEGASCSDGSVYGYFVGGSTNNSTLTTTIDRIVFSSAVIAANTSSLPTAGRFAVGISDNAVYGYFTGIDEGTGYLTKIDRMTFSSSNYAAFTSSTISQARMWVAAVNGVIAGYVLGGYTGTGVKTADKLSFSSGASAANTVSNLAVTRYYASGLNDFTV